MSEHQKEKEMAGVREVGKEVLGTLAVLNQQAKEIRKLSAILN